jgi:anaerobic ribonucleoside-triphosphate reductase activating protein
MKYTDTQIGFQEFPNEISLLINISNCPFHCPGCHSPELWEDVGTELTFKELHHLISINKGITCVGFMGGVPKEINELAEYVKNIGPPLKVGWYWGGTDIPKEIYLINFDYIKLGPYIKELGGLDNPNTNQRFYKIKNEQLIDWTYKFWKHGNK